MPGGTYFLYTPSPQGRRAAASRFATAEAASQYLIAEHSICTVPWDDAGCFLRFSVTYEAADEAAEDALMAETERGSMARIDDVSLGEGGEGGLPMGEDTRDEIEGVGLVLDARGRQIRSYPLFASIWANSEQLSPYRTDINRRRAETLALGFAQWLPGKMGL